MWSTFSGSVTCVEAIISPLPLHLNATPLNILCLACDAIVAYPTRP